jgi:hypothetical protein
MGMVSKAYVVAEVVARGAIVTVDVAREDWGACGSGERGEREHHGEELHFVVDNVDIDVEGIITKGSRKS